MKITITRSRTGSFARRVVSLCAVLALLMSTVSPVSAETSSAGAPALAGLAAVPAAAGEAVPSTSDPSPFHLDGIGAPGAGPAPLALLSSDPAPTAKFTPPETPYNGAFTRSIPVEVLPFFGHTPRVAFDYNSGDDRMHGGNGFAPLGVGWSLSGGSIIERQSLHGGAPRYDDTDRFALDGNTLMDCVTDAGQRATPSCNAGGTHTPRYETFQRVSYDDVLDTWAVADRDGTVSLYEPLGYFNPGGTQDTRLRTGYRWLLARVTDTDGNIQSYAYDCAALPSCYVTSITYGPSTIAFYWETRTDPFTYATGISLGRFDRRLKTVTVSAGAALARAYKVTYSQSPDTLRSLVMSIRQYGSDAVLTSGTITAGTALPADAFTYTTTSDLRTGAALDKASPDTAVDQGQIKRYPEEPDLAAVDGFVVDLRGDGRQDAFSAANDATKCANAQHPGAGYYPNGQASQHLTDDTGIGAVNLCYSIGAGDFNGDGKSDVYTVGAISAGNINSSFKPILTGQGYASSDAGIAVTYFDGTTILGGAVVGVGAPHSGANAGLHNVNQEAKAIVGDFNGDGLDDIFRGDMYLSTGTGFTRVSWPNADWGRVGDYNGDGLADLFVLDGTNGTTSRLLLSNGAGFDVVPLNMTLTANRGSLYWPEFEHGKKNGGSADDEKHLGTWAWGDWNGDGLTDVANSLNAIYYANGVGFTPATPTLSLLGNYYAGADLFAENRSVLFTVRTSCQFGAGGGCTHIWASSGYVTPADAALSEVFHMSGSGANPNYPFTLGGDFNGDGKVDLEWRNVPIENNASVPDLMKRHTAPAGGTTDVTFLPSSYWSNGYLPMIVQAVSKVTVSDGLGASWTTKYAYSGGAYDPFERKFLGFAQVTAELPCEADETTCPWMIAHYRQEPVAAGSLASLDIYAPNGTDQRKTEYGYVVNQITAPFSAFKTSEQTTDYLSGGSAVTREEWSYDGYANVLTDNRLGVVGSTADDALTANAYQLDLSAYIVDALTHTTVTDAASQVLRETSFYYDGASAETVDPVKGHVTTTRKWLASESRWIGSTRQYDSFGNMIAETDPLGNRTETDYDSATHQFVVATRNPLYFDGDPRQATGSTWNGPCAAPATKTDLNGLVTSYTYDPLCRPTRIDYPGGTYQATAYVNTGVPATQYIETDANPADGTNPIWARDYLDGLGRTYKHTGIGATPAAAAVETDTRFANRGPVLKTSLPYFVGGTVYWTQTKSDVLDRPVLVTLPDSKTIATAYEAPAVAPGAVTIKTTDPLARFTRVTRSATGTDIARTGYLGATAVTTGFSYDPLGQLMGATDPNGNVFAYSYDTLGRKVASADPDLGMWSYAYDDGDRLRTQTDARAEVTAFTYDRLGRVLTRTSAQGLPDEEVVTNTYDEARTGFSNVGQLTTAANQNAVIRTDYDIGGRKAKESTTVGSSTYDVTTAYDAGGRVTAKTYPGAVSSGAYAYNAAGQQVGQVGAITGTTYDAAGRVLTISYANGVVATYTYSPQRGWVNTVSIVKGAATIASWTYSHDFAGRITAIAGNRTEDSWTYGYDDLDRLLSAANTNTPALSQTFTYDLAGNMLTNSAVGTYAYPTQGSAAVQPHAVQTAGAWAFGYDADGNQTSRSTAGLADRTVAYDGDNRPSSVTTPGGTVAYLYGPDGARLEKVTGAGTTLFIGDDIERDPSGTFSFYVNPDVRLSGGVNTYLHRDHLASVRRITDATGALTRTSVYEPYGQQVETVVVPSPTESKSWIGERTDPEDGLTYLHARFYDAILSRFLSPDSWDVTDASVGTNRYAYAGGDPVDGSDRDGHVVDTWWLTVTGRLDQLESGDSFKLTNSTRAAMGFGHFFQSGDDETEIDCACSSAMGGGGDPWDFLGPEVTMETNANEREMVGARPIDSGNAAGRPSPNSVWSLGPWPRGIAVEVSRGHNLPSNFPVIDRFEGGVATSIKSIDLSSRSYGAQGPLRSILERYVDRVADFGGATWGGVRIQASDVTSRALELVVSPGAGVAQQSVVNEVVRYGLDKGVSVFVFVQP